MTENAARKPRFTRRGVILGSAALVLVLAVALVVFGGKSSGSVRTTLMGFERSGDNSSFLAVLSVTNETTMEFMLFYTVEGSAVLGRFHSQSDYVECWPGRRIGENAFDAFEGYSFEPKSGRVVKVLLPNDGRAGRAEVSLGTREMVPTGPLGRLRQWWRSHIPLRKNAPQAICDQEIQCPLVLPDGTVEPPRLLSGPERKR